MPGLLQGRNGLMPDRVLRDEILTSERYWSVSIEAQRLFVHLILNADDLARFSGKNYTIRTACFPGQAVDPSKVEKMLAELQDVDLIRVYEIANERFLLIPRFKQRLRFTTSRYPAPPKGISDLVEEKSDSSPTLVGHASGSRPQKRSEVKRSEEVLPASNAKIAFSAEGEWSNISPKQRELWERAYPALSLDAELAAAAAWLIANPKNRKSNYARFLNGWMQRAQDRAPRKAHAGSSSFSGGVE
jgi:hypothetical protein